MLPAAVEHAEARLVVSDCVDLSWAVPISSAKHSDPCRIPHRDQA